MSAGYPICMPHHVFGIFRSAAKNCVVLIYVNINEPRHRMMRAFLRTSRCGGKHVDPVGLRAANSRDRYHHLAAAKLLSHRKI